VAKKPRTPDPPRRVQAPKQRHTGGGGLTADRRRMLLYGAAGVAAIVVVVVVVVVLAGGNSSKAVSTTNVSAALEAAGCTFSTSKGSSTPSHITSFDTTVKYSTYPPVSGHHYYQPAIWGNYAQAVDPRQAVHNQEHGGIVIWVGPGVSAAERKKISNFYDESPNALLVTPIEDESKGVKYPAHAKPDSTIYLTAWSTGKPGDYANATNNVAACPGFNEKAFTAFRDEFRGKGPEAFPVSTLTPGT
jgi:uncharacterized protein DUF3105